MPTRDAPNRTWSGAPTAARPPETKAADPRSPQAAENASPSVIAGAGRPGSFRYCLTSPVTVSVTLI